MVSMFCWGRRETMRPGKRSIRARDLLSLPLSGGPNVDRMAAQGDPRRVPFPRAWLADSLDFSFSGLKTSIRTFVDKDKGKTPLPDIAASFQAAIVEILTGKLRRAAQQTGIRTVCYCRGRRGEPGAECGSPYHGTRRRTATGYPRIRTLHRQRRHDRRCRILPSAARLAGWAGFRYPGDRGARLRSDTRPRVAFLAVYISPESLCALSFQRRSDYRTVCAASASAHPDTEPFVWAIDDWHSPVYFLPRDCPGPASGFSDHHAGRSGALLDLYAMPYGDRGGVGLALPAYSLRCSTATPFPRSLFSPWKIMGCM